MLFVFLLCLSLKKKAVRPIKIKMTIRNKLYLKGKKYPKHKTKQKNTHFFPIKYYIYIYIYNVCVSKCLYDQS